MCGDHPTRSSEAFYGRRRGKALKTQGRQAIDALLPAWRILMDEPAPDPLMALFPHKPEKICLEIGFGGGEHLLHVAQLDSASGFIGVEPFVNSMAKFLRDANDVGLENVRVHDDDATALLDWLPDESLDRIDLLYPDPWPKKKHWKRRFVSQTNLDRFHRVLKPNGFFRFASDIDTYVNWTLDHIHSHGGFEWTAKSADDWRLPWQGWTRTRYEAKAIREERTPCYLIFQKRTTASGNDL